MTQAYLSIALIVLLISLFIYGRWRFDVTAMLVLLIGLVSKVVPFSQAFSGFSDPAVITVLCVMVISQVITNSGLIEQLIQKIKLPYRNVTIHSIFLCAIAGLLSAFMNNVGALALMMPIAIKNAMRHKYSPSLILMPLSFASVLGGLTTLIGTPPNILIATYREQLTGHSFSMFDFSPVGLPLAIIGIVFVSWLGWRLIPKARKGSVDVSDLFHIEDYMTEVKIPQGSKLHGETRRALEERSDSEFVIVGLIRGRKRRFVIPRNEILQENDILIIEATHSDLKKLLEKTGLELATEKAISKETLNTEEIALVEAVIPAGSRLEGRSAREIRLRQRYHLNLLAIARQGKSFQQRLYEAKLKAGDVILLQGESETLHERSVQLGLLPLIERGVSVGAKLPVYWPLIIFAAAIALSIFRFLPVPIAFSAAVLVMVMTKFITMRQAYESIDWSVIVLLGCIIPIGHALQSSGATALLASGMAILGHHIGSTMILILVMMITMSLSDVMNNAATAVVMAPIAVGIAQALHVHIDPFLMAVAIGASCSFLTPISHQNNTLVMGPGGYKFFDYIYLGLPLELLILLSSIPLILWIWPL